MHQSIIRGCLPVVCCLGVLSVVGCGANGNIAPVHGKVVYNGQPVTGGALTFAPLTTETEGARPAVASIQPDGTFVAETDAADNGAAIGRHTVYYTPPVSMWVAPEQWDGRGAPPRAPQGPYDRLGTKQREIEVKPGQNELTIELAPRV